MLRALGRGASRPRDLTRTLGVHQTLAWKIMRVARSHDLFADAAYIPGVDGLDRFLTAAAACNVPTAHLDRVRQAYTAFQQLVREHARDRASLDQMLTSLADDHRAQADTRSFRKAGFRCASITWGMQTRIRILAKILAPSETSRQLDLVLIRGFIGMRRIRPGAPLTLARVVVLDNDGHARRAATSQPLDPVGVQAGVPLLRAFCSSDLPPVRLVPGPDGVPEQQLGEGPIGERAAVSLFSGEWQHAAVSRYRDEHNTVSNTAVSVRSPIETMVIDLWAHKDIFGRSKPKAMLFGELRGIPWYRQHAGAAERLPLAEDVVTLGRDLARARITGAPIYTDVMNDAFTRRDWNPADFVLHRLKMEYPVIATAMVLQMPLPEAPQHSQSRARI